MNGRPSVRQGAEAARSKPAARASGYARLGSSLPRWHGAAGSKRSAERTPSAPQKSQKASPFHAKSAAPTPRTEHEGESQVRPQAPWYLPRRWAGARSATYALPSARRRLSPIVQIRTVKASAGATRPARSARSRARRAATRPSTWGSPCSAGVIDVKGSSSSTIASPFSGDQQTVVGVERPLSFTCSGKVAFDWK